ncbi:MAG: hypothetical protein CBC12_07345 [Candidatus Puniceispirillum sp. TMED52]|jgi:hypothetical protein|nr:MAG: hypothetical protein CBC12_07345 [Candidatus Puniceispirillum sp. TMED52]
MDNLSITTGVGLICVILAFHRKYFEEKDVRKKRKILCGCLRTCGNMCIPLILMASIPTGDKKCAAVLPGILWIFAMNMIDSYLLFNVESSSDDRPASIRMEPSCITGLTFALCGYIGARSDHKYGNLFLYAVIACLACVLPSHNMKMGSIEEQIFESFQKSVLFACISFLMTGVCLVQWNKETVS